MASNLAVAHFARRALETRAAVLAGIVAGGCFVQLNCPAATLILGEAAFLAPAVRNVIRSNRERNGVALPDFLSVNRGGGERRAFPELPFDDPFDSSLPTLSLEDRITAAAEASKDFGRTIVVLVLKLPFYEEVAVRQGRSRADHLARVCAELLGSKLRVTDYVSVFDELYLAACVNLINDLQVLPGIQARLSDALLSSGMWRGEAPPRFGSAIYPMDGYTGSALIHAARSRADTQTRRRGS